MSGAELRCRNCDEMVAWDDLVAIKRPLGALGLYHDSADNENLPCGPVGEVTVNP